MRNNKRISIINQSYMRQQERQRLQKARRKKLLIRRLTVFAIFAFIIIGSLVKTVYSQSKVLDEKQLAEMQTTVIEEEQSCCRNRLSFRMRNISKYARQEYFYPMTGDYFFHSGR